MSSIKLFYHPNSATCIGLQIPPTRSLRKLMSVSSSSKSFARDRAKELLTAAKKQMESRCSSFSSSSQQFVPAASISHEVDGSVASILHYDKKSHRVVEKERNINGVGVDIVLPSRIEKQCRRNWGTHEFSRRWLGIDNVKQLEMALRISEERKWKEMAARSNNNNFDPLTLSCALMWGWRESTIKALSDFKYLDKNRDNFHENKGSSAAPTFSIQHTKIGSISTSSFVVDAEQGSSLTLIQVGQMVRRCGGANEDEKVLEQWRASLAAGGSSTMNRINAEKVSMGAIVLNPGKFEKVGESVVVCFTIVE